jgi:ribosome-binding protein aMBF1 (putative translation factor)
MDAGKLGELRVLALAKFTCRLISTATFSRAKANLFWDGPTVVYHRSKRTKSLRNDSYKRFRELLLETRKRAGLTQAEVSAKLQRPQSFISKYEQGERRLDVIEFCEVADALGVDPLRFLRRFREE